ncbi:UvrD-helicase domain-containing protein [Angustibacter sp. Root456]|uniref:UvrD-helicase domain-containing protein n=1 Tax=Angustibacter sp. Root456 TaxID=1736539 RepID=UPI001910D58F|nr:UvrD-helicase domain-containing protein [Angustibacter sp. Root456]
MSAPQVFDVCGPLPSGTTVLEASAGTGKTFTIAALATRFVAEGVAELSQLLLVTFGRAATSELRDRVRERMVSAERLLRAPGARASADDVVRHLAAVDDAELDRRRGRLTRALAQFDAATIATTHGFCQQMLASLGVTGDHDAGAVLVPDIADLVDEVVDDLYLQRYAAAAQPTLTPAEARRAARDAVSDPLAVLEPRTLDPHTVPGHRVAFAGAARREVEHRKRVRRVHDYDDLVLLLRDALLHPVHGPVAAERVRSRYRVVLVDEFQDTDPAQWDILRAAFHTHRTLVLIGDPKQAIYAFRGGDVVAYLSARRVADTTATLGRSWRSDEPLLRGLDHLLRGAALGDDEILVRPVEAAHTGRRLDGGPPLRLRQVSRGALGSRGKGLPRVGPARELVVRDVAVDIVRQLQSTRLRDGDGWRPLLPADVAVLTRRNADATAVRDELASMGVPAVVSGLSSVFATAAAADWLTLLSALEQPTHAGRAAALALTPFVGWDAQRLAQASDAERDDLSDQVRTWSRVVTEGGVAALVESVAAGGVAERLLRTRGGERALTDVRHVGQALQVVAVRERLGVSALTDWLRRRITEAGEDYAEDRSRRLETDAAAVQVVTVHASKGLEFPVVYVPFGWDRFESRTPQTLRYHDDDGRRTIHVGGPDDPGYAAARERHLDEERGEDLRLLYVALTRARSQVVAWYVPSSTSAGGPLSRVLLGDFAPGQQPPASVPTATDDTIAGRLHDLAARSGGTVAVETVQTLPEAVRWSPAAVERGELAVGAFTRHLDLTWRRTSYTALTAAAHDLAVEAAEAAVASEPEVTGTQDEHAVSASAAHPAPGSHSAECGHLTPALADFPAGAAFGTLVHEVLEHVDTAAPDLRVELERACAAAGTARVPGVDLAGLAGALEPVLRTPLGPPAAGLCLADVAPADRLAELEFELPLAGGDRPAHAGFTLGAVARVLADHLPADDVFADYPTRLAEIGALSGRVRGYLTGSLDAVLRVRDADGEPRYLVVDYKTNRLAPPDEPLTTWHYRPQALVEAMTRAHYPLQLLLYSVALHRYLRWRQRGYDPQHHLGGGLYLFVRGMCGPDTPRVDGVPAGVLAWRPPAPAVVELSALLDGVDRQGIDRRGGDHDR